MKIDAGELILCEGMRYSGGVVNDYFHGSGELYLLDGIEIKGEWKKGFLKKGTIFFNEIQELKYLQVDQVNNKTLYTLVKQKDSV